MNESLVKRFNFWLSIYDDAGDVFNKKQSLKLVTDILLDPLASTSDIQYFMTKLSPLKQGDVLLPETFNTLCCKVLKNLKTKFFNHDIGDSDYYQIVASISILTNTDMKSHVLAENILSNIPDSDAYMSLAKSNINQATSELNMGISRKSSICYGTFFSFNFLICFY